MCSSRYSRETSGLHREGGMGGVGRSIFSEEKTYREPKSSAKYSIEMLMLGSDGWHSKHTRRQKQHNNTAGAGTQMTKNKKT